MTYKKFHDGMTGQSTTSTPQKFEPVSQQNLTALEFNIKLTFTYNHDDAHSNFFFFFFWFSAAVQQVNDFYLHHHFHAPLTKFNEERFL